MLSRVRLPYPFGLTSSALYGTPQPHDEWGTAVVIRTPDAGLAVIGGEEALWVRLGSPGCLGRTRHRKKAALDTKRILLVFGTRPEAIKLAPVALELAECEGVTSRICVTAQHRSMLDDALRIFDIRPHYDLDIMRPDQTLSGIAGVLLRELDPVLADFQPHWVLVQGDTTSTMAAALTAFHRRIRVGHVEAGLRTHDLDNPFPEEANRRVTSVVASRHYCPTARARQNLLKEGVPDDRILVTGNTVIDALKLIDARVSRDTALQQQMHERFSWLDSNRRLILVTGHRRESFGEGFRQICQALATLGARDDVQIVYPVHLNPNVQGPVHEILSNRPAIRLTEPLDYVSFVWLMRRAFFILTDSGGIQEEAPAFGKPVLVMRDVTERPEGIEAGTTRLVGTRADRIVTECLGLFDDKARYRAMSAAANPFGDGTAGRRIVQDLADGRAV
jgi:UDP-N-acetylglucosamine 2-epimerase (non-hydrolysing)